MDASSATAPPVVAVVVTCDPSEGLEEALTALGSQDHPELAVLVIDDGSQVDVTDRVAAVLPTAYVRRLDEPVGYGAAANLVLEMVSGAAFLFFCHDDVAPASDAVRLLVEEAVRSNAGVVAPKVVAWDDHERLLAVGVGIDRVGTPIPLVDRRELDQEQHDTPRELVAAPGVALLVRADLFAAVGGFDPTYTAPAPEHAGGGPAAGPDLGEDIDLCWRARLAGARIVTAPAARVAHAEHSHRFPVGSLEIGQRARQRAWTTNQLVTPAKNLPLAWFVLFLPVFVSRTLRTVLGAFVQGPRSSAASALAAWRGLFRRSPAILRARGATHAFRQISNAEIRHLQMPLGTRLRRALREDVAEDSDRVFELAGRTITASVLGPRRWVVGTLAGLAAVELFGARDLLAGRIPAIGQFTPLATPSTLVRHALSGWRTTGMGSQTAAPPAFGLLAVLGTLFLGCVDQLRKLLVLGLLPVGLYGAWRVARRHAPGADRAPAVRVAAVVAYAAVALPYNALALGRWDGLLAYGATPWLLDLLLRTADASPDTTGRLRWARVLPIGVVLAVGTMLVPSLPFVLGVLAAGFALGSVLTGRATEARRIVTTALGGGAAALVLLFPWSLTFLLGGSEWGLLTGGDRARTHPLGLGDLLRFHTGPAGGSVFGWAVALGAALALVLAVGDRFVWTVRLWSVGIVGIAAMWVAGRGWAGDVVPAPEIVLAPVALGFALALGGVVEDTRRSAFGWRQAALVAGAATLALATLPLFAGSVDGRWEVPRRDHAGALAWLPEQVEQGPFRVLWLGSPDVLPLAGWRLDADLAYATSRDGLPDVLSSWPGPAQGGTPFVRAALDEAMATRTSRLGQLLGPMAIRYVVVVEQLSPGRGLRRPAPGDLRDALRGQLDLRKLDTETGLTVYENTAWAPQRILLTPSVRDASRLPGLAGSRTAELRGALPALLTSSSPTRFSGTVPQGSSIGVADSLSDQWAVRAAGRTIAPRRSFGWAMAFDLPTPVVAGVPTEIDVTAPSVTLVFRTPLLARLMTLIQAGLWVLALALLRRERQGARRAAKAARPAAFRATDDWEGTDEEATATVWDDSFSDESTPEGRLADEMWEVFRRRSLSGRGDRRGADSGNDDDPDADSEAGWRSLSGARALAPVGAREPGRGRVRRERDGATGTGGRGQAARGKAGRGDGRREGSHRDPANRDDRPPDDPGART